MSQDGWHLPRSALDKFEDVKNAYDRRGAAFTFDGAAFSTFVQSLRSSSLGAGIVVPSQTNDHAASSDPRSEPLTTGETVLYAPGFSHTLKDPTANAIAIQPHHKVVVIEGLYTFLGIEPWSAASLLLDERWFIDVDPKVARGRLVRRHVVTGVAKDMDEAEWRADNNDIPSEYTPLVLPPSSVSNDLLAHLYSQMVNSYGRTCFSLLASLRALMIRSWLPMAVRNDPEAVIVLV